MTASSVLASCHKRNSWDFCAGFCPHAASGHAAALPSSVMKDALERAFAIALALGGVPGSGNSDGSLLT
jgi:hypothetical protein